MPSTSPDLITYLRVMAGTWRNDPRDDSQLVARYAETRDEAAFAALAWRHGMVVWRVCRHILGDTPDAEDAFQSTFLTLSRKAGRFPVASLAGWLHRVARQAALNIRAGVQRRRKLELRMRTVVEPKVEKAGEIDRAKLYEGLDEELANLPEKLRLPLLMHYIEGKSHAEVARILGCAKYAIQKRLAKGEAILSERLERRGLTLGAVTVVALLGNTGSAPAVPSRLIESTARAAVAFHSGMLTSGPADAAQKLLRTLAVQGVTRTSWWLIVTCIGMLGFSGIGWVAWKMFGDGSDTAMPAASNSASSKSTIEQCNERLDRYGDPLPARADARIGTIRFRSGFTDNFGSINTAAVAFLPDNKTLVSVHNGDFVCFWETSTGKQIRRLAAPVGCKKVALTSDGQKMALVGDFEVWGLDLTMNPSRKWLCHPVKRGYLKDAAFSPDNKVLAVADEKVCLFDADTGGIKRTWTTKQKYGEHTLAFMPDSKILVFENGLWDIATGAKRIELKGLLDKNKNPIGIHSWAVSPDGRKIAATHWGNNHAFYIWDAITGKVLSQVDGDNHSGFIAFQSEEKTLIEVNGNKIYFWNPETGKAKLPVEVTCNDSFGNADDACLSSNGQLLARVDGLKVGVWEVSTGREIGPLGALPKVTALALAPDTKRVVTLSGCFGADIRIWESKTGQLLQKMDRYKDGIRPPLDFSDGQRIITGVITFPSGCQLVGFNVRTGKVSHDRLPAPPAPLSNANDYALSPDGRWQIWGSKSHDKYILGSKPK